MEDISEYLNNFFKGTKNTSLNGMKYLTEIYEKFHTNMKFIHIAGTNGKGSCTEMMSNILQKQGYKVGKFLSPHLINYNERISINGQEISDTEMWELIHELTPKIEEYRENNQSGITLFELETMMGLLYFYRNNVDFVVMETGLGGICDGTNIIDKPLVSMITSIGYDHTHILGNTLVEIAQKKAGIIKENSNTVFFAQTDEVNQVLKMTCEEKNNKLHLVNNNDIKNYRYDEDYQLFDYKEFSNIAVNLKGLKQINNASICIEATKILNELGYKVSEQSIREGLSTVIHPGRMEVLNKKPLIIFDGAHNVPAIENLQQTVNMYYNNFKRVYIISILKRKDYGKMLELLMQDKDATFVLTSGNDENRYASSEELNSSIKDNNCARIYKNNLNNAIENALQEDENTVSFIVGSFYTYGTVANKLKEKSLQTDKKML